MDRQCTRCGVVYPAELVERAFRLQRGRRDISRLRKTICQRCVQTARDNKKRGNRWLDKARSTRRRHAHNLEVSVEELERRGWDLVRMAHDAEFQYGNGCSYCGDPYKDMGHGFYDITLDIQDPDDPPDYRTNTKWCCQTCNRSKGRLTPQQFEAEQQVTYLWQHRSLDPLSFAHASGTPSLFAAAS